MLVLGLLEVLGACTVMLVAKVAVVGTLASKNSQLDLPSPASLAPLPTDQLLHVDGSPIMWEKSLVGLGSL